MPTAMLAGPAAVVDNRHEALESAADRICRLNEGGHVGVFGFASRHGARQRVNHDGGGPLVTKLEFDLRNERFGLGDEVDRHQDQPEGYGWHLVAEAMSDEGKHALAQ